MPISLWEAAGAVVRERLLTQLAWIHGAALGQVLDDELQRAQPEPTGEVLVGKSAVDAADSEAMRSALRL